MFGTGPVADREKPVAVVSSIAMGRRAAATISFNMFSRNSRKGLTRVGGWGRRTQNSKVGPGMDRTVSTRRRGGLRLQPADLKWASDLDDSQYQLLQVALDNHILHRAHRNLQEVRISGIREMPINFLLGVSVQCPELVHEVFAGLLPVVCGALVVHEAVRGDGTDCDLFFEQVHLVEEEDKGRLGEPMRVGNGFPEHQRLVHLVL